MRMLALDVLVGGSALVLPPFASVARAGKWPASGVPSRDHRQQLRQQQNLTMLLGSLLVVPTSA
jgi:hypothetical protein